MLIVCKGNDFARKKRKRGGHKCICPPRLVRRFLAYSPGLIAPLGQTSAHVPQSTHTLGSIEYFSPSLIAPLGHSSMHVPHATQSSLITYAMMDFLIKLVCVCWISCSSCKFTHLSQTAKCRRIFFVSAADGTVLAEMCLPLSLKYLLLHSVCFQTTHFARRPCQSSRE